MRISDWSSDVCSSDLTQAFADAAQLKSGLLKQALARGEKPKPVEIERAVTRIPTDREIRSTLARLSAAGAKVESLDCDVRDETSLGAEIGRASCRERVCP